MVSVVTNLSCWTICYVWSNAAFAKIPSTATLMVAKDPPRNAIAMGKEATNLSADNLTSQVNID